MFGKLFVKMPLFVFEFSQQRLSNTAGSKLSKHYLRYVRLEQIRRHFILLTFEVSDRPIALF